MRKVVNDILHFQDVHQKTKMIYFLVVVVFLNYYCSEVLLMEEPCSALEPIATNHVEDLMRGPNEHYTIIIVTHSMQQAARVSQQTGFFHMGSLVEVGETEQIFQNPVDKRTRDYITGRSEYAPK